MSRFHQRQPGTNFYALVLDQYGNGISNATVKVTTQYFYPMRIVRGTETKSAVEIVETDSKGLAKFRRSHSHQAMNTLLDISKNGYSSLILNVADFPDCPNPADPKRILLWRGGMEPKQITLKITDHEFGVLYKIRWTNKPMHFDLLTSSFAENGGDFVFNLSRPAFEDPEKKSKAVGIRIEANEGSILPCSRDEYARAFAEGVPAWSKSNSVAFEVGGMTGLEFNCAFSSREGQIRGRARMLIRPVAEIEYRKKPDRNDNEALVEFTIQTFSTRMEVWHSRRSRAVRLRR